MNSSKTAIVASGTPVRRPSGQTEPASPDAAPGFGPSRLLDYELELGFFVGPGNALGAPIPLAEAEQHPERREGQQGEFHCEVGLHGAPWPMRARRAG